jgi:hypothetical protein
MRRLIFFETDGTVLHGIPLLVSSDERSQKTLDPFAHAQPTPIPHAGKSPSFLLVMNALSRDLSPLSTVHRGHHFNLCLKQIPTAMNPAEDNSLIPLIEPNLAQAIPICVNILFQRSRTENF